jgi:alpha-methylacyl-CoA racemase
MSEATNHPHMQHRSTIINRDGVDQPAPAPRFSRTVAEVERSAPWPGQHTDEALTDWGFDGDAVAKLREVGAVK